jgi:hypothetical protein
MAVAYVQAVAAPAEGDGSVSASFGSLPTIGNRVFVAAGASGQFGTGNIAVSDNQGHSYTQVLGTTEDFGFGAQLHYCDVVTSSGTFTITVANSSGFSPSTAFLAAEFSGVGAVDQSVLNSGVNVSATGDLSGSSAAGCLELAYIVENVAVVTTVDSVSPAYTSVASESSGWTQDLSYRILTGSTNVGCSWTNTSGPCDTVLFAVTFLEAAVAGSPQRKRYGGVAFSASNARLPIRRW